MTETKLSKDEARQGETRGNVRYILVISTVAAIVALIIAFLVI